MCSEFQVRATPKEIEEAMAVALHNFSDETQKGTRWDKTVRMSGTAPVLIKHKEGLGISEKIFPVRPFPNARLSGFENQSDGGEAGELDEAQVRRIYDVPLWKQGFATHPCLVPMTSFTEFAYWGPEMGSALKFEIPKEDIVFAAGLLVKPYTPHGKPFDGFSIVTHTATEEMLQYHHRMVAVFKGQQALGYLDKMSPSERVEYILEHRYVGDLKVEKIRAMAKGWEKRIDKQKAKLHQELRFQAKLKEEHVSG